MSLLQVFVFGAVFGSAVTALGVWVGVWVEAHLFRGSDD